MNFKPWLAALALALGVAAAHSQTAYPDKPVKILVPYSPGGGADVQARLLATRLTERLKQPVVVENKTGAGGNLASVALAQAAPDGYTLLLATVATVVNPNLWARAGYARKDFVGVASVSNSALLIVAHPSLPVKDVRELIEHARANPGKLSYASGGAGAVTQIEMELLKQRANIDLLHIPFAGQAPAVASVVGGQVPMMADSVASGMPMVKAGRLRALAITSKERSPLAPELKTVVEQGYPELANTAWYGLIAPTGTPPAVLRVLSNAVREVLALPETLRALEQVGAEPYFMDSDEFSRFMDAEGAKWAQVLKTAGIRIE